MKGWSGGAASWWIIFWNPNRVKNRARGACQSPQAVPAKATEVMGLFMEGVKQELKTLTEDVFLPCLNSSFKGWRTENEKCAPLLGTQLALGYHKAAS